MSTEPERVSYSKPGFLDHIEVLVNLANMKPRGNQYLVQ